MEPGNDDSESGENSTDPESESVGNNEGSGTNQRQSPDSARQEEIERIRQAQLAALEHELELKRLTVAALRREADERVDEFRRLVDTEKLRRNDNWWSEVMKRQPNYAPRVRRVNEMWSGPKKTAEAKKLWRELEGRRRNLAVCRAFVMRGMENEEPTEDMRGYCLVRPLRLQNQGEDRSCATCGYRSAETSDNDDTLAEYNQTPRQEQRQTPAQRQSTPQSRLNDLQQVYGQAELVYAQEMFTSQFGAGRGIPRPSSPTSRDQPQASGNQTNIDSDYQLALALQRAEMRNVGENTGA